MLSFSGFVAYVRRLDIINRGFRLSILFFLSLLLTRWMMEKASEGSVVQEP